MRGRRRLSTELSSQVLLPLSIEGRSVVAPLTEQVVKLALLIVRAGEHDSLKWWDDEALTEAGLFALSRTFPRNPRQAAVRLAFLAASERHRGVLHPAGVRGAATLLDFAGEDLAATQERASIMTAVRAEPITSVDQLRVLLQGLAPEIVALELPAPSADGLLDLTNLVGRTRPGPQARSALLAAGYLQGQVGKPVIPYLRAGTSGGL